MSTIKLQQESFSSICMSAVELTELSNGSTISRPFSSANIKALFLLGYKSRCSVTTSDGMQRH